MEFEMKLQPKFFDLIKNGQKIYEIRLNDEKRKLIDVSDVIVFKKEPDLLQSVRTRVEELKHFATFEDVLENIPLAEIGFDGFNTKEVIDIYHNFYLPKDELVYGVLAIKIKLIWFMF